MFSPTLASKKSYLFLLVLALFALLIAAVPLLARDDTAVAQDPDFSAVDDPLNGDYELFTVDDLVISRATPLDNKTKLEIDTYLLETANETVSNSSKRTLATAPCFNTVGAVQPQLTRAGRFFVIDHDVMVTLAPTPTNAFPNCDGNGAENMALYVSDLDMTTPEMYSLALSPFNIGIVMADFNLDGFQDLLLMGENEGHTSLELVAATAVDINDRSQGLAFGPKTQSNGVRAPLTDAMTGDFNADGLLDVAWGSLANVVEFATVCPGNVAGTVCAGKQPLEIIPNPLQSQAQPIQGDIGECLYVAAGRFGDFQRDSLVAFDCPSNTNPRARWYAFNDDFTIAGGVPLDSLVYGNATNIEGHYAVGRLDWLGEETDQIAVLLGYIGFCGVGKGFNMSSQIGVFSFSGNQMIHKISQGPESKCFPNLNSVPPWINGLALGHFSAIADNPNSADDFNLQIAAYFNDGALRVYSVNPENNFAPQLLTNVDVGTALGITPKDTDEGQTPNALLAADLQGRSQHLGPPSVMRIDSHTQPSIILGAPPMHIDYILPDTTTATEADIINFTAVPDAYRSQYTVQQTGSNQTSDTSTTSYSFTTTEKGEAGFNLKPPYVPSIKGSIAHATTDKDETVSRNYAFQQNEFQYDASTLTGFSDEIWYSSNSFNLYVYRVLGETVCPADNPNCTPDEEQPLYVMFSGPNSSGAGPAAGATTEWYQPVHEPGNIFSYPWNQAQLQNRVGSFNLLTGPQHFFTDGSTQTQSLTWSQSQGSNVTAGTSNNHSYEKGYSLTAGKTIGKILDVNLQGNINYNESSSLETLNQSTSSIGASQGIAITKPGSFLNFALYQYRVEPYIFGRTAAPQTVDQPDLSETIQTYGPLQAAFAANPLAAGGGSWWTSSTNPYKQNFDVALNHPVRWTQTSQPSASGLNCLSGNCFLFNAPDPSNLWNSEFYWMRGLFVTVNGFNGPQRTQATAGDTVYLTARVYNYSLMDMPSGSTIKVRFYRQQVNGTVPSGNSVLIEEVNLTPLPGFNSSSAPSTPNWTTADTSFDTSGLGDTTHIFWVLVWAEDSNGALISELPGHGLSARPGTLNTIADVPLEQVMYAGASKTFSNNVGYLHSRFYIAPADAPGNPFADPVLTIQDARVTPAETSPGERVIVSADILSEGAAADGVHVQFFPDTAAWQAYRQDPSLPPPRAFDVEMLPHIKAGETDHLEIPYRTAACGTQNILIVTQADPDAEPVTATATYSNGPCLTYFPVLGGR